MTTRRSLLHAVAAILAQPLSAWAQDTATTRRIGVLSTGSPDPAAQVVFRELMRRTGFDEGKNLVVERRYAKGEAERVAAYAQELVRLKVDLIFAFPNHAIAEARRATASIPIVMFAAANPVESGFIESLARPGGNVTGTAFVSSEIAGKHLQVLKEAVPRTTRVAVLFNPTMPAIKGYNAVAEQAAGALGVALQYFAVTRPDEVGAALDRIVASRCDALYIVTDPVIDDRVPEIAVFALKHKLASIGPTPGLANAGGLLYYGPNLQDVFARTISYIERILRGAQPAELPVEMPARFEMVLNLKTAKALGITMPQSILLRADKVIE